MGISHPNMSFAPFARGYGYPAAQFGGYGGDSFGYAPYGAYGPSLEEVKKIREAEEKAFKDAEAKRMELIDAEKKAVEDAVTKEKEFYEKERELVKKLGGYPYAFGGAHGYGYPGYAGYGAGHNAGAYGAYPGYGHDAYGARAGAGYPYRF